MALREQPLRVALAQTNPTVGDLAANARQISELTVRAREQGAQLAVFGELALTGYPPEDLLLKTDFLASAQEALESLATGITGIVALVGFPLHADDVYNAAALIADGEVKGVYRKQHLPNYGVFDEQRYFQAGALPAMFELDGVPLGITICEDIWEPGPPATELALAGARAIVNLSASPYHAGKGSERERMLIQRASDSAVAVLYTNLVGGQDELVFDGGSVAIDQSGEVLARAPQFEEALAIVEIDPAGVVAARLRDPGHRQSVRRGAGAQVQRLGALTVEPSRSPDLALGRIAEPLAPDAEVYTALTLGLRDYVLKNGFGAVVLGISGGIDSALVALLAVDALGADRVSLAVMPSPHSSTATQDDARRIAANLRTELLDLPIEAPMESFDGVLAQPFAGRERDLTEENLQARIRGTLLMALSNKLGSLVLTTGNKSELAVGYSTLYGDMAGGFAVLKDVFKGTVYRLVRWRNERADGELIPASVLERAPSAELRPDQLDSDSLPDYARLDAILLDYVERDLGPADLAARGHDAGEVERVIRMVDRAEYKRRQAPPGIRISRKAFGRDRRLPVTNHFESGASGSQRRLRAL